MVSSVNTGSGVGPNQGVDPNQGIDPSQPAGSGSLNQTNVSPDIQSQFYNSIMSGLQKLAPKGDYAGGKLEILLAAFTMMAKDLLDKTEKEKAGIEAEKKQTANQAKREKLEEATKKIQEAIEKRDNASIFDKVKIGLGALAALLTIAVGIAIIAATAATGVGVAAGAVAGSLLIAAGVVGLAMTVDSIVAMETGNGIAGSIALAFGADKEEAAWADMGFQLAMAALSIGLAVASLFTGNVGALATTISIAIRVAAIASAGLDVVTAGIDVASQVHKFEASMLNAEAKENQADAMELDALMQMLDDVIDQALSMLMASADRFNGMLDDIVDSMNERGSTLSRAKFSG